MIGIDRFMHIWNKKFQGSSSVERGVKCQVIIYMCVTGIRSSFGAVMDIRDPELRLLYCCAAANAKCFEPVRN